MPILGILPFLRDLELDQEDSLEIERYRHTPFTPSSVNVAVTLLPRMSNFTDFNSLAAEPDIALRYVASPRDLVGADVVILPGSKNTIVDLLHLRRSGFPYALKEHVDHGGELVGICGGFQMLGRRISDPHRVEEGGDAEGLGFLDVTTELLPQKITVQVEARPLCFQTPPECTVRGYEIHAGLTRRGASLPCFKVLRRAGQKGVGEETEEGAACQDRPIWGTSIHGLFDQPGFRRFWINRVRQRKGLPPSGAAVSEGVTARLRSALDLWADHLQKHLDVGRIFAYLGLKSC